MKKRNNTPAKQGYRFVRSDGRGLAIFQEITTGGLELYARRSTGVASWCLHWKGADWEFCGSVKE